MMLPKSGGKFHPQTVVWDSLGSCLVFYGITILEWFTSELALSAQGLDGADMSGGNCMGTGYGDGSIWAKNVAIRSHNPPGLGPGPIHFWNLHGGSMIIGEYIINYLILGRWDSIYIYIYKDSIIYARGKWIGQMDCELKDPRQSSTGS